MGSCFSWVILAAACVFVMASLIRWFEQTADAVDHRDWNKLSVLLAFPFMVWKYESKVIAGRPVALPHFEPVKGFGGLPKGGIVGPPVEPIELPAAPKAAPPKTVFPEGGPPPGTPKEFLGMPVVPPPKPKSKSAVDPDKLAKLRQKMMEQGMIKPPSDDQEKKD